MIYEVLVETRERDLRGASLLREIEATLGITSVTAVHTKRVYRLEGISLEQATELAQNLLCEPQTQSFEIGNGEPSNQGWFEVAYKPGVMNPETASILKAGHDRGMQDLVAADSSWLYRFEGLPTDAEMTQIFDRLLVNKTVERIVTEKPTTLLIKSEPGKIEIIPVSNLTDAELLELSTKCNLFLNLAEMRVIQQYFKDLGREPRDGELEILAQTWSEHCCHKTLQARLIVDGQEKKPLFTRLKEEANKHLGGVLSAFVDNSGVFHFYDGFAVCGKLETHNAPSALEPYGGANTGTGGVIRDPMGTGLGAKTIHSIDIFCLPPPNLPLEMIPSGCLPPRYLFRNIVAGVRDYGNRMGIPTGNGSVHFHPDFRAKPCVIVGAVGIMPADKCQKGQPRPGDLIITIGGRTGLDGIHGATFSSGAMTDQTATINSRAVQIGNAIEEKRVEDAVLECRDANLIRAITDCGAGGFASAVGEMGAETGVRLELEKAPVKYQGMSPCWILISESQERMVLAVAPENADRVLLICRDHNVEATIIGVFTDDHKMTVTFNGEILCDLPMEFLHHGLPQRVMTATKRTVFPRPGFHIPEPQSSDVWTDIYHKVLAHGNVCSKEPIVRTYDHGVQGTSALQPFSGVNCDGPNDAVVLRPLLNKPYGLIFAHGLNPILNRIDPYTGSIWATVEALSNLVAVGGNFRDTVLIDNFIWPFPDEESLWDLDQSMEACIRIMQIFGIPFISGKDSLGGTFRWGNFVLEIPPVLCVSALGKIPDVTKTVSADFKKAGSHIVLVGKPDFENLGGSVYYDQFGQLGNRVPNVNVFQLPKLFDWLHSQIVEGNVSACHDISEGGLATTLAEMCFGGGLGAKVRIPRSYYGRPDHWFFHETAGCFLLEAPTDRFSKFAKSAFDKDVQTMVTMIGFVTEDYNVSLTHRNQQLFSASLETLKKSWQQPMREVF